MASATPVSGWAVQTGVPLTSVMPESRTDRCRKSLALGRGCYRGSPLSLLYGPAHGLPPLLRAPFCPAWRPIGRSLTPGPRGSVFINAERVALVGDTGLTRMTAC